MQKNSYRNILYFITIVTLITLGIQVYWNFKNYEAGKQQLINEVQISIDNAVDQYYENLAKQNTIGFTSDSSDLKAFLKKSNFSGFLKKIDSGKVDFRSFTFPDSIDYHGISVFRGISIDSMDHNIVQVSDTALNTIPISIDSIANEIDSLRRKITLEKLTSKIIISINEDDIQLPTLDSIFKNELERKKIDIAYGIRFLDNKKSSVSIYEAVITEADLQTNTKSSYLPRGSSLTIFFTNATQTILKKNLLGIVLSFLLVGSVIGCLLYLLNIIRHQKQLSEVKNDLISNITHEFKTPIATISAALEGIQVFNTNNDPKKTQKYVSISSTQLGKLNIMVEKILETATLHSDELKLNLEETNLVTLVAAVVKKHQANSPNKQIEFQCAEEIIQKTIDAFHIENAINNIIDNAIKYGGDRIIVHIHKTQNQTIIDIKDTGSSLSKVHTEKIFEKFYRVPKGNTHDIKGFGIGLFYTKTIIDKHHGTIRLVLANDFTTFKISLPNE